MLAVTEKNEKLTQNFIFSSAEVIGVPIPNLYDLISSALIWGKHTWLYCGHK